MDPVQILLFVVVSVLTSLLVAVGMQAFFILRQLKHTIVKLDKVLEDAHVLTSSIARPIVGFTSFVESMKHVCDLVDFILERRKGSSPKSELPQDQLPTASTPITFEEEQPRHPAVAALQERGRRFFHRDGKPLTS